MSDEAAPAGVHGAALPARRSGRRSDAVARYLGSLQAEAMNILWERNHATVRDVLESINKRHKRKLAYTTVLTIVSRLYARGLLSREPEGRGFRYRPSVSRPELLAQLSDELIDQLFEDFGDVAIARLGSRLAELDPSRRSSSTPMRKS